MEQKPARSVPLRIKLGFGIGDLGGNLFFTIVGFYLLFYLTDAVKLGAGLAGTALMIGKISDAVSDPIVGYCSDRTRHRWGRRRPWILWGSIALFFSMILMFTPPPFESQGMLFLAVAALFVLLSTAYTLVNIPYASLLPELTQDFHQRTVLTGYRMSFAVVGTFVGAGAVLPIVGRFGGRPAGWTVMGGVMGAIMAATALVTFLTVREPAAQPAPAGEGFARTFARALRSRVFLTAVLPWTLHIAGVTVIQGALLYYFKYIYGAEGLFQVALLFLLVSSLAFIFVWVRISRRIGKKHSYNLGMGLFALGVLAFFLFAGRGGPVVAFIILGFSGIGFSTHYVMPHSIVPDVVECDYAETGVRREGVYYSLWTFASKVGQALALALSGWVLGLFGYVPDAPVTGLSRLGIRLLCGPIPLVFFAAGIVVLSFYPVNGAYYARVLEKIAALERRASGEKAGPAAAS